jgi:hypothetical protein
MGKGGGDFFMISMCPRRPMAGPLGGGLLVGQHWQLVVHDLGGTGVSEHKGIRCNELNLCSAVADPVRSALSEPKA